MQSASNTCWTLNWSWEEVVELNAGSDLKKQSSMLQVLLLNYQISLV